MLKQNGKKNILESTMYSTEPNLFKKNTFHFNKYIFPLFIVFNEKTKKYTLPSKITHYSNNKINVISDTFCILCSKNFSNKFKLKYHIEEHHLKLYYTKCPYCKEFSNNINFLYSGLFEPSTLIKKILDKIIGSSNSKTFDKYIIKTDMLLEEGTFSQVFFGINKITYSPLAAKFQKINAKRDDFLPEANFLTV